MKRIITPLLLILLVALAACGGSTPTATPSATPSSPEPQPTPEAGDTAPQDHTAQAAQIVSDLAAGDFAAVSAKFDSTMAAAITTEQLAQIWQSLETQFGSFKSQKDVVSLSSQQNTVVVTTAFEQGDIDIQLSFNAANQISGLYFRPSATSAAPTTAPSASDAWREIEVHFGTAPWIITGTLTLPTGDGPFPAAVIVQGSGPSDRNGAFGPNKPYLDLAHGLAEQQIASLRYDKRTFIYHTLGDDPAQATVQAEVIDDTLAALDFLRQQEQINPERTYLIGHSLGGMLAPRIASADEQLSGMVMLAAPARPLPQLIIDQTIYLAQLDGSISAAEQEQIDQLKQQATLAMSPTLTMDTPASDLPFNTPAAYWIDLRDYDQVAVAKQLKLPILILQGERDYQVTVADDLAIWQDALGQQPNVTIKQEPKLNHLFIAGEGQPSPAEYDQPSHVAQPVIDDIAAWIQAH